MLNRLLLLSLLLFNYSCSASPSESGSPNPEGFTTASTDSLPFAIVENFQELEPLFHLQNDTIYVINFWATWCKPCVAELPWFEQLHKEMVNQPVKVVLISMDFPKQYETKLLPFIRERQLKPQVIALADLDYNSWIDKVSNEWDGAIPFTLIYKNNQRMTKMGELDSYQQLIQMIEELRH